MWDQKMKNADKVYKSKKYRDLLNTLDENIEKESNYEREKNWIAASNTGFMTWSCIKEIMKHLNSDGVYELRHTIPYDLLHWADAFATNLHNASRSNTAYLQKKFLFCQEYVEMHQDFLERNVRNLGNIRRYFAEHYAELGDFETFDNLYYGWLNKEPDWEWGWIGWSDAYWLFLGKNLPNLQKAMQILENGLAIKDMGAKKHMIDRYDELKKKINDELKNF